MEGSLDWSLIIKLLAAVGGLSGIAALINSLTKASAGKVANLVKIIDAQAKRITELEGELSKVRAELAEWKARYYELAEWVRGLGLEPFEGCE